MNDAAKKLAEALQSDEMTESMTANVMQELQKMGLPLTELLEGKLMLMPVAVGPKMTAKIQQNTQQPPEAFYRELCLAAREDYIASQGASDAGAEEGPSDA